MINKSILNTMPSHMGVYIFKEDNVPIYIGKSINIRSRIKSHFENAKYDTKEKAIISKSSTIDYKICDSEFKAIILESQLIKEYEPYYNVICKDDKNFLYIKITIDAVYPKISLVRKERDVHALYFGPFSSYKEALFLMRSIRRIIPFCSEPSVENKPCFYSKIGLCNPCPNAIEKMKDIIAKKLLRTKYKHQINNVIKILKGETKYVTIRLQNAMRKLSLNKQYEEAILFRNKINMLNYLIHERWFNTDLHLEMDPEKQIKILYDLLKEYFPNLKKIDRIECYDVSNFALDQATASMVVLTKGILDKSQYRKFKIKSHKKEALGDIDMLKEAIKRRFNNNWNFPDIIVVDGGLSHVSSVSTLLSDMKKVVPVIGIAKDPDRLVLINGLNKPTRISQTKADFQLIRLLRDESHRFAKKYHLFLRTQNFFNQFQ